MCSKMGAKVKKKEKAVIFFEQMPRFMFVLAKIYIYFY